MIASTMPLLTIHHKTEYRYAHPVAFGEHRIMLRPRDGHDLRVLSGNLEIVPEPMSLRWIHDVFGNSVAIATFDERAETLSFSSTATVEHNPAEEFALTPDDRAYFYPFLYNDEEFPDLVQFITPQYADPDGELSAWARNFLDAEGPTPTFNILSGMTHGIRKQFSYRKRHEHGTQHPLDKIGRASCRERVFGLV
jgi:transglutaminase-like putative cysteine protease